MDIRQLIDKNGTEFLPLAHARGIQIDGGVILQDKLNSDDLQTALKEDKLTTMKEKYTSIIQPIIQEYSYQNMIDNINQLQAKYSDKLTVETIGTTMLGRDIKAVILGNKNGTNKALVMSGQHARESHNTPIVLKQIEYYCENWNELFDGEKLNDIFKNSAIFYVPSANPDGLELQRIRTASDWDIAVPMSYPNRSTLIAQIKTAVEWKFKNDLTLNADITAEMDLYSRVVWTGNKGKIADYTFRDKDMYIWKSNANGVDLHYNNWQLGYNGEFVQSYCTPANNFRDTFATEDYIGASGFSELETQAVKAFIEKYSITKYAISYHGKGPTMFYQYKQTGKQAQRNRRIAQDLADLSNTVYSESNNGMVGFTGWFYSKYTSGLEFCAVRETGWGNTKKNSDNNYVDSSSTYTVCPLPNDQFDWVWGAEKQTMLLFLKRYVRRQDLKVRDGLIMEYDYTYDKYNSDIDGVVVNPTGIMEQWGVSVFTFSNTNYAEKTITFKKPFTYRNFGGHANNYTTSETIQGKKFDIKMTRDSLIECKISVICESVLNTDVPINWYVRGV